MDDPEARAELDDQAAAQERSEALMDYRIAGNMSSTADSLRQMGFDGAGDVLDQGASSEMHVGDTNMTQALLLTDAAKAWRTAGHDLEEQAKATGQSFAAAATQTSAEDKLQHAANDSEKTQAEATVAAAGAAEASLQHRATELGHDAQAAASTAIADEAKARNVGR